MEYLKKVMASTHVDKHNERMTLEGLQSALKQLNEKYLLVGVEHDPRVAPIGRIIGGEIKPLEDGEHALIATIEAWGKGSVPPYIPNPAREMVITDRPIGEIEIIFDRSYRLAETRQKILELAQLIGSKHSEAVKKAADPLSVLIVAIGVGAAGTGHGFFSRLGGDLYDEFKQRLVELLHRNKSDPEKVLQFQFNIHSDGRQIEALVNLTNPSSDELDHFLSNGDAELQRFVDFYMKQPDEAVARLVFRYFKRELYLSFAVRRDAIPLFPESPDRND